MNFNEENLTSVSLRKLAVLMMNSLKKLWAVLILLTVLGGAAMGARAWYSYTPYYTASTTFTVYVKNDAQAGITMYNSAVAEQMEKTFPYILTSGVLNELVKEDLGVDMLPAISATSVEDANLFVLSVSGPDAEECYRVLESVIKNYPQVSEMVIGPTEMIVVDDAGVPTEPVNTRSWQGAAKNGALIGFALGAIIIVVYGLTKMTVMGKDDLQRASNARFIGALPEINMKKRSKSTHTLVAFDGANDNGYRESFRAISVRVDKYMKEKGYQALLICSTTSGEGKTTVAYNLAHLLVKLQRKVIILDCDLRNPSMYKMLDVNKCAGIAEFVDSGEEFEKVVHNLIPQKLDIVFAGNTDEDATEVFSAPKFKELVERLKAEYDYIIIDTPPCSLLSDTEDLAEYSDGALMVVRQNYASRASVLDGLVRLDEINMPVIGYILNICKGSAVGGYGYGSGYGYGYGYGNGYGYGYGNGYGYGEDKE